MNARIICPACGKVEISKEEYTRQLKRPDAKWRCPHCHADCQFDDDYFESFLDYFGFEEKEARY